MSKRSIVIGNWKMNPLSSREAKQWFEQIAKLNSRVKNTEIVVCPPFVYFSGLKKISRKIKLGAQDAFSDDVGPFTGEVSAGMLYEMGASYVILGHSERRALGETDTLINRKVKGALAAGLTPILCVGERERDLDHEYFNTVRFQVRDALAGVSRDSLPKLIVAYEPVWALSSTKDRKDATPGDSREMAVFIKKVISDISSPQIAAKVRIIYGGSVNERDAEGFIREGAVDGLLVGRVSMDPKKFTEIIRLCEASKN